MDDYISREAAIKKFEDAEYLYDPEPGAKRYTVEDAKEILNDVPAADVRPVVLCRDCRHSRLMRDGFLYCTTFEAWNIKKDFFCPFGKQCGAKMGGTDR